MVVRIITDLAEARRTVLRRAPLQAAEVPPEVLDLTARVLGEPLPPAAAVARILAMVRDEGDRALLALNRAFEGAERARLEVSREEIAAAYAAVPPALVEALRFAAERIRRFHEKQLPRSWVEWTPEGTLGTLVRPLERVGVYVPGGMAAYPSTLLMQVIPAQVAGVAEIVVVSPPRAAGSVRPTTLVAADIAGVQRLFAVGGAQAIAALAYGTESIPRVDKIVGAGNLFVTLAKQQVFGLVGIDQTAGPTETLIVADETADPEEVAADLLAQAEHDVLAAPVLITPVLALARAVAAAIERQLPALERAAIIRAAFQNRGGIVVVPDRETALALANEYAPEHLCLMVRDPWAALGQVRHAGGVFVGAASPEAIGDYTAGPSHVMPTGGTARFASPLTVFDFLKFTSLFAFTPDQVARLGPPAITLAEAEGLTAHAAAIRRRLARRETAP
jgi:histidinol dehydrogenase